jgi:hypothetical protein
MKTKINKSGQQIVHVIGGSEKSLFGHIDNVPAHHLDPFQEEITQSYRKKKLF